MQVLVRAAFFLWLTVVNLVALSAVWARIADVFGSAASKRLFGFLGAGATCGEATLQLFDVSGFHVTITQSCAAKNLERLALAAVV